MLDRAVLFTRTVAAYPTLKQQLYDLGYELTGISFIQTEPLPIVPFSLDFQWLFFVSPSAVKHFFSRCKYLPAGVKTAVLGAGTRDALPPNIQADYTGICSNPADVAKDFGRVLGENHVAIVCGSRSMGRVRLNLPPNQCRDLVVYRTVTVPKKINFVPEVVVFSSPSNVEGFLASNSWLSGMKAVAFGETTAAALNTASVEPVFVSVGFDEKSLTKAILAAIGV